MAVLAPEVPSLARDQAFETLYRRYAKDVYHYALALLRNPADAEDITQTTFMNAYCAYKRGEEPIKPQHWLIKIAHNAARTSYARASRRVKEVPLEDHLEQLSVPEEDRPDVEAVLEALGRLPLNQRAALVLRELEGRTYAEIADTLSVSVPAVETLIFRARRALRLKASAVRVPGVVTLPSSLAQLFESGAGVAAGGSTLFGSSFLLKAAVAVVAGAVATGVVGGERTQPAAPKLGVDAASFPAPKGELSLRMHAPSAIRLRHVFRRVVDSAARPDGANPARFVGSGDAASPANVQATDQTSSTAAATAQVTSAVDQLTSTSSVLAVPVTVPQLPSPPPVQLPPLPPPPPLP